LQEPIHKIKEITEGSTKMLVPHHAMIDEVPPKEPAFFNPRARLNRDFSIIAYSAFWKSFKGPKIFLDGLSGIGARGLRVANELDCEKVVANDINQKALELAHKSAILNNLKNFEVFEDEVCRFFSSFSKKGKRGSIVDIDPFGSPTKYLDCAIRATMHGGLLSTTATDLQVLHGLFQNACKRRYHGIPVKTEYGNEIAIRLILGGIVTVADRLDIKIVPVFADNDMHYYRTYTIVLNRPNQEDNIGYILHCKSCGHRDTAKEQKNTCEICNTNLQVAGPLWIGPLFNKEFVQSMINEESQLSVDKKCLNVLQKCLEESEMPGTYFTLDEIAARMKTAPVSISKAISSLRKEGFLASHTCLRPTGFRTNCRINKIMEIFSN